MRLPSTGLLTGRRLIDGPWIASVNQYLDKYLDFQIVSSLNQMMDQQHGPSMLLRDSILRILKYQVLEPS